MAEIMMALGNFVFGLDTAAHQTLTRSSEYRWPEQERLGRRPASQYVGPGSESISLDGVVYPQFRGGLGQVEAMRAEASSGRPRQLVDGLGKVLGKWVIERVEETQTIFFADGTPRKMEFRLGLKRYGEDR